jgi:hypothetical protein
MKKQLIENINAFETTDNNFIYMIASLQLND